jgi:predicted amidohydrolase
VLPAAFTLQTGKDHWEVLCRARAIETQSYFLAAAMIGPFDQGGEKRHTYGHSLVCDPWGHVIAKASDGIGPVSARLDKELIAKARADIPLQSHKVL